MINSRHYLTQPLSTNDGYTWTLASRLGAMLREIENLYGERDKSWTFVGVEFEKNGPQNWFPGNCGNIAIQLNTNALDNEILAHYQLAHEVVHLLAPDGKRGAPIIEEGLATLYSEDFISREYGATGYTNMPSYIDAAKSVRDLLSFDPEAIKKLRAVQPSFKEMTVETFKIANINYPQEKILKLISAFVRT
ncbi:hypothetical protein H5085_02460 [Pseudoalteromonas sp. SR43-6]|uniref:hypothetical protein n=1 Tax=unclassified Pseudoalteromonas TaxID=194690 RepID=UPI0015F9E201|nr:MULTISPECIES: hypothetical protein [unclassified Pseudoalteromonas]MBB1287666.1 hypothetical protein [Pseudoalteromonas sp. SR41-5]MBB1373204.1 hypothetical protein [Pseudoalteromonas sp. SR43-6]MBB1412307.1 hypothetical protein [Pseudoalteromonas sp. SG43-8]